MGYKKDIVWGILFIVILAAISYFLSYSFVSVKEKDLKSERAKEKIVKQFFINFGIAVVSSGLLFLVFMYLI